MTEIRSPLRIVRALLFAVTCVLLTALGHTLTSGHGMPPGVPLAAAPPVAALAWAAAGRVRGTAEISLALLAVQGALHAYFTAALPHGTTTAGHPAAHGGGPGAAGAMAGAGGAHAESPLGASPFAMVCAHVLAALFCALWLSHGETAFLRLLHAAGTLAFTPLRAPLRAVPVPAPPVPVARPRRRAARPRPLDGLFGHTLVRRGPPAHRAANATAPGATV
ncbi:hypothetical protein [Streptomyces uncialis]|uniref:hypothetical protein n=1 Tax=Streptomyces uncialis TaxID=1048205 RepID=UPI003400CDDC